MRAALVQGGYGEARKALAEARARLAELEEEAATARTVATEAAAEAQRRRQSASRASLGQSLATATEKIEKLLADFCERHSGELTAIAAAIEQRQGAAAALSFRP